MRARVHTHCGPLPWVGIGIVGRAVPKARLNAGLYFEKRALWMSAGARPFLILWDGKGGWPISDIIASILNLLGNLTLLLVSLIGARWTRKLVDLPDVFPGTDFEYEPKLDGTVVNIEGNLAVLGTIDFLPNQ